MRECSMPTKKSLLWYLSLLVSLLVVFVAVFGFADQSIYTAKLNTISLAELMGQDLVSLLVGLLGLVFLLAYQQANKLMAITWLGCLTYFAYIYAYFSFSLVSSIFFILYLAIFGLSLFCFVFLLAGMNRGSDCLVVNPLYPRRALSIFFVAVVVIMLGIELTYMVQTTIVAGSSLKLFDAFYSLDLAIVFPAMIIAAVLNWRKKTIGHVLIGVILVKVITIMPALLFNDVFHWLQTGRFLDLTFDFIALAFTVCAGFFLFAYKRGIQA
jgi:hypothetical protein